MSTELLLLLAVNSVRFPANQEVQFTNSHTTKQRSYDSAYGSFFLQVSEFHICKV